MCDEFTLADDKATLSRRQFGAIGAAAAALGMAGEAMAATPAGLNEATVSITTPDGTCDAFFVHPTKGKYPAVILWPDIGGLRESHMVQARWIAAKGYAVLAVNQYYRGGKAPVLPSFAAWRTPEGQATLKPMIAQINPGATTRDAKAFVAWLDKQAAVNTKRGIGTCGFCMGGPMTVRTAAAVPSRVRAAASFHGGGLVGDAVDAPIKLLPATKASYLFAIAKNDDARAPGDKDALKAAAAAAGRKAEIEVYSGDHGWTVPDAPIYNKAEGDRAFARMYALFAGL